MVKIIKTLALSLWGPFTVILILCAGVIVSLCIGFVQFKPRVIRSALHRSKTGGVSPMSALMTALSGCVGVGNIVGVGTAIAIGGPGALFWMWVSALPGMALKFYEVYLAKTYADGQTGSPVQYIRKALGLKSMAYLYAVCGFICSLSTGNLIQCAAMTDIASSRGIPPIIAASVAALLCLLIASKGIRRLSSVLSAFIPIAIGAYIGGCLFIIFVNRQNLPAVFSSIFKGAFGIKAAAGGGMGLALKAGFARGVFSNEAGTGTSCLSHCASSETPVKQAVFGIFEVFTDTLLICTMTGLTLLVTGSSGGMLACSDAFFSVFGEVGRSFTDIILICFSFSTLAAWCYYGQSFYFILGGKKKSVYLTLFAFIMIVGGVTNSENLWYFADIFNAATLFINLTALMALLPRHTGMIRRDLTALTSRRRP